MWFAKSPGAGDLPGAPAAAVASRGRRLVLRGAFGAGEARWRAPVASPGGEPGLPMVGVVFGGNPGPLAGNSFFFLLASLLT